VPAAVSGGGAGLRSATSGTRSAIWLRWRAARGRRALTFDEVQWLFEGGSRPRVDEEVILRGRKGMLAALRDAALFKGPSTRSGLRPPGSGDAGTWPIFRRNPRMPGYGLFGSVARPLRQGGQRQPATGAGMVLTVPEMDWGPSGSSLSGWDSCAQRSFLASQPHCGWTERRSRISTRRIDEIFAEGTRPGRGLPEGAGPALPCATPTFSHLVRVRLPAAVRPSSRFGHAVASTTAIYTSVSDEFRKPAAGGRRSASSGRPWRTL